MIRMNASRFTRAITHSLLLALLLSLALCASPARPASASGLTVAVEPLGNGLQFHASAAVAVDWDIQVSLGTILTSPFPPHFQTGGTLPPRVHRFSSQGQAESQFAPYAGSLLPNANYNYIVRGGSLYTTGTIRTFTNRVTVVYNRIDVIDDSDSLSPGDLTFFFNAGKGFDRQFGEVQAPSGKPVVLPDGRSVISQRIFNQVGNLRLAVEGVDDDYDPPFEACRNGQPPDGSSGSDNCFDWATATFAASVSQTQNLTTRTVAFQTTAFPLKFQVVATITVEYGDVFVV